MRAVLSLFVAHVRIRAALSLADAALRFAPRWYRQQFWHTYEYGQRTSPPGYAGGPV